MYFFFVDFDSDYLAQLAHDVGINLGDGARQIAESILYKMCRHIEIHRVYC